jgi:hypothetical protein
MSTSETIYLELYRKIISIKTFNCLIYMYIRISIVSDILTSHLKPTFHKRMTKETCWSGMPLNDNTMQ